MPELFGSPYIVPAIAVVVVLMLVLVLLRVRAKRKLDVKARNGKATGAAQVTTNSQTTRGPAPVPGLEPAGKPDKRALRAAAQAQKAEAQAQRAEAQAQAQAARSADKAARSGKGRSRRGETGGTPADLDTEMDYLTDELPEAEAAAFTPGGGNLGAGTAAGLGAAATIETANAGTIPLPPLWPDAATPEAAAPLPEEDLYAPPAAIAEHRPRSGRGGQPAPKKDVLAASDPVRMVVADILAGWGDLAAEDTNRLEVFRPERVMAAISAAELPKDLKNSEYARTRLTQLRRYAAYLEHGDERPIVATSEHEFSGLAGERLSATAPKAAANAGAVAVAPAVGAAPVVGAEPVAFAVDGSSAPDGLTPAAPAVPAVPASDVASPTTSAATSDTGSVAPAARESDIAHANKSTEAAIAAAAAAFWARSDAPARPPAQSELATPADPVQTEPVPGVKASPLNVWATDEVLPHPPVAEKPILQWEPLVPPADIPAAPPTKAGPGPAETARSHDDFLKSMGGKISTAAGLMALPLADREEMLVLLGPDELAKAFAAAENSEFKKNVIDALEDIGTSSALDVIHSCLEDPDPEVQIHALDAADRLLAAD